MTANNSLTGQIPSELEELQELRGLELSNNDFTGSILKELGNLSQLESLNLGAYTVQQTHVILEINHCLVCT